MSEHPPPQEWCQVVAAVEAGDDAGDGLGLDHLARAEAITRHANGSMTFRVERHPHLLSRPTRGQPSSAFRIVWCTYRWRVSGGIDVLHKQEGEICIDRHALAQEEVDDFFEALDVEHDIPALAGCRTESEAANIAARFFRDIDWFLLKDRHDIDDAIVRELRDCVASCQDEAVGRLVEWWREKRSPHRRSR